MYQLEWYYDLIDKWIEDDIFFFKRSATKNALKQTLKEPSYKPHRKDERKWRVLDLKTNQIILELIKPENK